jgi:hypothetical protein
LPTKRNGHAARDENALIAPSIEMERRWMVAAWPLRIRISPLGPLTKERRPTVARRCELIAPRGDYEGARADAKRGAPEGAWTKGKTRAVSSRMT